MQTFCLSFYQKQESHYMQTFFFDLQLISRIEKFIIKKEIVSFVKRRSGCFYQPALKNI